MARRVDVVTDVGQAGASVVAPSGGPSDRESAGCGVLLGRTDQVDCCLDRRRRDECAGGRAPADCPVLPGADDVGAVVFAGDGVLVAAEPLVRLWVRDESPDLRMTSPPNSPANTATDTKAATSNGVLRDDRRPGGWFPGGPYSVCGRGCRRYCGHAVGGAPCAARYGVCGGPNGVRCGGPRGRACGGGGSIAGGARRRPECCSRDSLVSGDGLCTAGPACAEAAAACSCRRA